MATISTLYLTVYAIACLSFYVLLAGISAVQDSFGTNVRPVLGLPWFILCLQCVVLILTIPWAIIKRVSPVPVTTPTLQALLAVSAVLCIMMTDYWCGFSAVQSSKGRSNTVLTGFLILATMNLLLIIILGLDDTCVQSTHAPISSRAPASAAAAPAMPSKTAPGTGATPVAANTGTVASHPVRISEPGGSAV